MYHINLISIILAIEQNSYGGGGGRKKIRPLQLGGGGQGGSGLLRSRGRLRA
jgi:hypothetical protein